MKFLILGDMSQDLSLWEKIKEINFSNYDFFLLTGDISTGKDMWKIGRERALAGATNKKEIKGNLEKIHNELYKKFFEGYKQSIKVLEQISKKIKIYGVLGNADFEAFVNQTNLKDFVEIVHNKIVKIDDFYFIGYSGEPIKKFEAENPDKTDIVGFPIRWSSKNIHAFGEEEIYDNLSENMQKLDMKKTILVTHSPPYKILDKVKTEFTDWAIKCYGDSAKEGNVGSIGLKKIDEKFKPILHIFGHVHERKGIKKIEETTFINTGSTEDFSEVVEVEIVGSKIKVEFRKI